MNFQNFRKLYTIVYYVHQPVICWGCLTVMTFLTLFLSRQCRLPYSKYEITAP